MLLHQQTTQLLIANITDISTVFRFYKMCYYPYNKYIHMFVNANVTITFRIGKKANEMTTFGRKFNGKNKCPLVFYILQCMICVQHMCYTLCMLNGTFK